MSSSEDENTEGLLECIDQAFFPNSVLNSNKQCGPGNLQNKLDVTALAKSKKGNTPQPNQYYRTEKKDESLPFGMTILEPGAQRMLAKQLQRKLDEDLEFKDSHETSKSLLNNDDQGIRLLRQSGECLLLASNAKQPPKIQTKPDIQSRRRKRFESEDDTEVDFASIAVSPEWVMEKRGIYGNGREKQGELITGAVHSPLLKRYKL